MINLIPYPQKVSEYKGLCAIPKDVGFHLDGFDVTVLDLFKERIQTAFHEGAFLTISKTEALNQDAYTMRIVADSIQIAAGGEEGAHYALTSLYQLWQGENLPCCYIEDKPLLKHRGLNLDSARHFFEANEIKKIIDEISLVKMNVLHWHLSDDQGFRIESKKFPLLMKKNPRFYTQEEIKDIVAYAQKRFIEVVPEIDLPGHVTAILSAYPEYSCTKKPIEMKTTGGIFTTIFCAGGQKTKLFIYDLLDEVIDLFPSERFHIGGDEAPKKEWKNCPECQALLSKLNLQTFDELQGAFEKDIIAFLQSCGKTAICWSEVLEGDIAPDAQIQYWHVNHSKIAKKFIKNGGKMIYSDMFEYYFDYPESMTNLRRAYRSQPHLDCTSVINKLFGLECCIWTEHVDNPTLLNERIFPRLQAVAERAWRTRLSYESFEKRLTKFVSLPIHQAHFLDESKWNPKGKARHQEVVDYFKLLMGIMKNEDEKDNTEVTPLSLRFAYNFLTKFICLSDIKELLDLYK